MHVDVAIIGGGPAGSTMGVLLKKYDPSLRVLILERTVFPRDHVGESQLPAVSQVLNEMGCWDAVEAANFPIKVGATYCWGKTKELWDFNFLPQHLADTVQRPGKFDGLRWHLAFQVDRSIYDDILLRRAAEVGCDVRQGSRVVRIGVEGDHVTELEVDGLGSITADTYIDASGHSGILRRALGVSVEYPSALQNVAVWDYWRNAEWAERIGVGGTRVQVMSVGYGWIWFIPLGPDRTSVGLVVPVDYLKSSGASLPDLYGKALKEQPRIASLMTHAVSEGKLETTKDWSFLSQRQYGENWMLVGESSGFADPILAAGLTITHAAAREAAYTLLEERQGGAPAWLRASYEERQKRRISSHIRFADYWYTANSQFTDLQEFTAQIARDNGLELSPEKAWAWLAQGGFIDEDQGAGVAGFGLSHLRDLGNFIGTTQGDLVTESSNQFQAVLDGAVTEERTSYRFGRVRRISCLVRKGKIWPLENRFLFWYETLKQPISPPELDLEIMAYAEKALHGKSQFVRQEAFQLRMALEALISDGWVVGSLDEAFPPLLKSRGTPTLHLNASSRDGAGSSV